jgi:hypothetical protein
MQTLTFNSTTKIVKVYEGSANDSEIIYEWDRVPTVKPIDNYYEVYQKNEFDKTLPIARFPISNTNMLIYV